MKPPSAKRLRSSSPENKERGVDFDLVIDIGGLGVGRNFFARTNDNMVVRFFRLLKFWLGIPQRQLCPNCSADVTLVVRYPDYVCRECCARTADPDGRLVSFSNIDLSGGLRGRYEDNYEPYESDECFIDGKLCHAAEAHFGGVVVRPWSRPSLGRMR